MNVASRVLVIDDDLAVRMRIGDLLAQAGDYFLYEAADGPGGMATALEVRPDLILLDIMMPGMTGFEVCAALRADLRTREIPIIVLSAAEESDAMLKALEAGADDFLRKPFSAPELRAKIRTITRLNRFRGLVAERDRLRWLLDRSLEPLLIADERGALVFANQRARDVFGLGDDTGVDVVTAISRYFRAEPADAWAAWRELRLPPERRFAIYQPETSQVAARWYEVEMHVFERDLGHVLLKFTNRTGNVRRELETFTFQHLISHKIRTPLNGLAPILTLIADTETASLDAATRDLLQLAQDSADRLERTLMGVIEYQAAMHGGSSTDAPRRPKGLHEVVAAAAAAAGLPGKVDLDAKAVMTTHPERLEVALTEVLENYRKFSRALAMGVHGSLQQVRGRWELTLFASGPGLPPDVVAQLGRPYAQLERSFSGEIPGMGLGLATVRILLRSMGGDLVFQNHQNAPGLVTTLHLPLASIQAAAGHADEPRT